MQSVLPAHCWMRKSNAESTNEQRNESLAKCPRPLQRSGATIRLSDAVQRSGSTFCFINPIHRFAGSTFQQVLRFTYSFNPVDSNLDAFKIYVWEPQSAILLWPHTPLAAWCSSRRRSVTGPPLLPSFCASRWPVLPALFPDRVRNASPSVPSPSAPFFHE
jgi:hypothetical protein